MITLDEVIEDTKDYVDFLKSGVKGCLLTRCTKQKIKDIEYKTKNLLIREPLNTPFEVHSALNQYFIGNFGWPVRNGLFAYGMCNKFTDEDALGYGETYLLFPKGKFRYVFDPNIFDLYKHQLNFGKLNTKLEIKEFIKSINYQSTDLDKFIHIIKYRERSVEIMVRCNSYYLVDVKYSNEIIEKIWE